MSLSLYMSRKEPVDLARDWILWEYGPSFDVATSFPRTGGKQSFSVDGELVERIEDRKSNQSINFKTKIQNAATVDVDILTRSVTAPSLGHLKDAIQSRVRSIQRLLEKDVLKAENKQFGNLVLSKQMFTPIRRLLVQITRHEHASYEQFKNYDKYLRLLTLSGYIQREREMIVPTIKFVQMLKSLQGNYEEFESYLLGYLLAEHFDFIVDEANVKQIMPYTRLTASYYRPAGIAERLVWLDRDDLLRSYSMTYGRIRTEYFDQYLEELGKNDILRLEDNSVYGKKDTLDFIKGREYFQVSPYA